MIKVKEVLQLDATVAEWAGYLLLVLDDGSLARGELGYDGETPAMRIQKMKIEEAI